MNKRQKYGIRKYKMGAASIALGTVIVIGMSEGNEAHASETNSIELSSNTEVESNNGATGKPIEKKVGNENVEDSRNFENLSANLNNNEKLAINKEKADSISKPGDLVSSNITQNEIEAPTVVSYKKDSISNGGQIDTREDVSNKVEVVESSIVGQNNKTTINPHEAERVTLNYKWKFDKEIKEGDFFDFTISNNVDTRGISTKRKMPAILDSKNNKVIANGKVLSDGKLRYIFTNYVEKRTDISADLSLNLYFSPSIVLNKGNQKVTAEIANHKIEKNFYVDYLSGVKDNYGFNMEVNGRLSSINKENQSFTHIAYINPNEKFMNNIRITGSFENGAPIKKQKPILKIFKYNGEKPLAQSVYINFNTDKLVDVTEELSPILNENGNYSFKIDNLNGEIFIVKYDGFYNGSDTALKFRTELDGYHYSSNQYHYNKKFSKLTWDNSVVLYSNKANGNGKDKPIEPIYGFSQPINFETTTYKPEDKASCQPIIEIFEDSFPVETLTESGSDVGDSNYQTIEETEDTIHVDTDYVSHINTNHNADVVEIEEDSNPGGGSTHHTSNVVEFDEYSATGVVTGAISDHTIVEDTMEYITENNLIELEDDHTLPPHITGQAEGSIEEIEENSVIDINDFTMIDGDHGELTGVLEETDENHYIDINEYTMTEGSHGQATGIIEETEEYQHADILEMTTPIGENGATQGIIEEVEDSNLIEFDEETGNGAISGHVIGAVEEIEDSFYISTLSESGIEQGSNGSDTFVEDTSEDKPSVKTNSPDPIEIVEEIPRENGYTKGMIIEEDTKPPHFASPNMPKEEPQETQNQPKVNSPVDENNVDPKPTPKDKTIKVVEKVSSKSPKIHEEVMPKVKSETPSSNSIVSNKPNFAPVSSMPVKLKSNKKVTQNQQHHVKQKALPDTGNTSDKNLILMGGLISLLGFSIMRRKKVKQ
ncbi:YSIRK signal domain/LPXTG anchor domain surface protein [Staphylococcus hyicus]|uniref:YSIRK signal domain/LPXTG anchor domain surface protein n=1 Tax=Staphylococcus hyicus TaxID=1284 RepID=UPI00057F6041|nr:YSIRK signal domain/LPXTG anchor domain surface protein [Staphylococcus hyicus]AJC96302.1 fibronectin-binding protein [Staphylococcus hyicus]SQE47995.1 LPXTG family cell wall anchor protein [Staphylococcus hyicus]